jgi:type I restriction enzyme S subunit
MSVSTNVKKAPKLRFPGFSDEWDVKRFNNLVRKITESYNSASSSENYKSIELESLSQGSGELLQTFPSSQQKSMKTKFRKGDVLYGKLRPYLRKFYHADFDGVCTSEIWVLRAKDVTSDYLYNLVQTNQFNVVVDIQSGSKMPRADWKTVSSETFNIPGKDEQRKIAGFLGVMDDKISAMQKKKELLQEYKKGIMKRIFSQEIRFKDKNGQNYPAWQEKRGNEVFHSVSNRSNGQRLPILAITQDKGAVPRDQINYDISVTDASIDNYKVVAKGDFIISLRSFQGGIEYSDYDGICSPAYIILRSSIPIDEHFYKYFLKTKNYIQRLTTKLEGIRDGKMISFKYFSDALLLYPTLKEQQKIAEFLISIDMKIEVEERKLEQARQFKKALLQQMFV